MMKHKFLTHILFFILFISSLGQALYSDWSTPVSLLRTLSIQNPTVGIDEAGNAIIFTTVSDDVASFFPATLQIKNGVPRNFQKFKTENFIEGNAALSVNPAGDAVAVWLEVETFSLNFSLKSTLFNQNTWGPISTISNPSLFSTFQSIAPEVYMSTQGQVFTLWPCQTNSEHLFHIQTNHFSSHWLGEEHISIVSSLTTNPQLVGAPSGEVLTIWCQNDPLVLRAAFYDGKTWIPTDLSTDLIEQSTPQTALAMNTLKNALVLWVNQSARGISASFYSDSFSQPQSVYVPTANQSIQSIKVALDPKNNGIATWVVHDSVSQTYQLMASRFFNGSWQAVHVLDSAQRGEFLASPNLGIDGMGNGCLVWEKDLESGQSLIYANEYNVCNAGWREAPNLISNPALSSRTPKIATNLSGQTIVVWVEGDIKNHSLQAVYYQIEGSLSIALWAPKPPKRFRGKQERIDFLLQYDLVNVLKWNPSPDSHVAKYFLYRNDKKIATIPASGPFVYEDHKRVRKKKDTYKLVAVSIEDVESEPVTLVLP